MWSSDRRVDAVVAHPAWVRRRAHMKSDARARGQVGCNWAKLYLGASEGRGRVGREKGEEEEEEEGEGSHAG